MKRIAVIGIRGFPGIQGGVEKHCENLYPLMEDNTFFTVYRRKPYLNHNLKKEYKNIKFIDLPSTRIKGFEAVFHTFISTIHIIFDRPDAVHIHNIGPAMFAPLLRLFMLRVILTYHSPNYEHKKWGFFSRNLLKLCELFAINFSNKIIFVNKFQMEKYSKRVLRKSCYIPNGVNQFSRSEYDGYLREKGIPKNDYVLAVGRLTQEKGFEYLVEAVNKTDEIKHLVIAGASDHDQSYFNLLKKKDINKKVIFTGYTDGEDLCQLYSHARLFVLSSINEGFPLVLLEAMRYNLPLVVTDIPATHLVDIDRECYVPVADPDKMCDAIIYALKSNDHKKEYNLSNYDWRTVAYDTLKLF